MPLPESVVAQLGRDAPRTPGWSWGVISFAAGILFIAVFLWAGLEFGYKPFLENQATQVQSQINTVDQSVSQSDQVDLIDFYSQLSNLRTLLAAHTPTSNVFPWLEANTEANVYYSSFSLTADGQLSLIAQAKTENDANQQIAIFENSPQVIAFSTTGLSLEANGNWQFAAQLALAPSVFAATSTSTSQ
jgi:hypothetical protein